MAKLTLLDIAKRTNNDATVGIVEATIQQNALLSKLPFRGINGISFKYGRRVGLPTVGFKGLNQGIDASKSEITQILFETKNIGGRSEVDKLLAEADTRGVNALRAEEDAGFSASMGNLFNKTAFYGSSATTTGLEFDGFNTLLNKLSLDNVLDGGSTASNATTSVYAVAFGDAAGIQGRIRGVEGILGNNKNITAIDMGLQYAVDSSSKKYLAYTTEFEFAPGLAVYDTRSIGRIANLDNSHAVTFALLSELETKMRPFKISSFYVAPSTWLQLQALKVTDLQSNSQETELFRNVLTYNGIPILIDDNIKTDEAVVS